MAFVAVLARATWRRLYALGLFSVLVLLVPLAAASPPDVVSIVSATAVVSSILLLSPKPADSPTGTVRPMNAALLVATRSSTFIRAPPSSTRIATA